MTVEIVDQSVVDVSTAPLAARAFSVLYRFRAQLTVLFVVFGCGLSCRRRHVLLTRAALVPAPVGYTRQWWISV